MKKFGAYLINHFHCHSRAGGNPEILKTLDPCLRRDDKNDQKAIYELGSSWLLAMICVVFFANEVNAASKNWDDVLVTDRPDAAEASETVGKYRFQIETSFAFDHDEDAGVSTNNYNFPTLIKFGVTDWAEVRLEAPFLNIQTQTGTSSTTGFTDIDLGTKVHLQDNEGAAPSLGFLFHLTLPTGKDIFSANTVEPKFVVLMDWELPQKFSLGINFGLDIPVTDANGNKFARFLYAGALNRPLPIPALDDRLGMFIEFAGAVPMMEGPKGEHRFDTGFGFLLTPDMKIDTFAQVGLTEASPDIGTGLGFSWRIL
ncbi:MAG: hypothetical protein A3I05_05670 [Deltaproteobacteria bacterium RIFCSPLOWO2_02_FULL_44_10]|nr:MAG: hypothetical protein A3C46_04495 [Deltaproteobacteria bacterium RIFCSPHIGHO2_02_FULL_44_16]OGQ46100.1 MAG: hypothetical protein A3I05_05670 [Deltaproteobacteria bacterium RIFCSPLOWO2_02_FULL_44_10]